MGVLYNSNHGPWLTKYDHCQIEFVPNLLDLIFLFPYIVSRKFSQSKGCPPEQIKLAIYCSYFSYLQRNRLNHWITFVCVPSWSSLFHRDEAKIHKLGITILCVANLLLFASLLLSIIICCLVARGKLRIPSITRTQHNNTTTINTQVTSPDSMWVLNSFVNWHLDQPKFSLSNSSN